ncbi:hypothetical protein XFLAVUS301_32870 [Xanthobacter flavus]|uniref:Uncharacterized protein n=1 Tax=Xanthobacter flavus TaxID=281 RepID=A0A9W6FN48_XANFL|nr:hypothetical protein XFLAVUS301_32870 [Xanthobacter flavus]
MVACERDQTHTRCPAASNSTAAAHAPAPQPTTVTSMPCSLGLRAPPRDCGTAHADSNTLASL